MASSSTDGQQPRDYPRMVSEGLRALQRQEYETAIARLKSVMGDRQGPGSARLKAALGLFQAYGESGQTEAARQLGQQLKRHANPQVRDRATALWNRFFPAPMATTASGVETADRTVNSGFVPLDGGTPPAPQRSNFQPFTEAAPPPTAKRPRIQATPSGIQSPSQPSPAITPPAPPPSTSPTLSPPSAPPAAPPPRPRVVIQPQGRAAVGTPPKGMPAGEETTPPTATGPQPYVPRWHNAGKIAHWGTLPGAPGLEYQGLQVLSVIAFGAIAALPFVAIAWLYNRLVLLFDWIPAMGYLELVDLEPSSFVWVWVILAGMLAASPWLIDEALKRFCGGRSLRLLELNGQRPETGKILQRQCRRYQLSIPQLRLLPTADPILFSYGSWRSNTRLVLSQGALDALEDGELATLVGAELGHIITGDYRVMGWGNLVLALPFLVHWFTAQLIDRWQMPVPRFLAIALSILAYESFRLGRWPLFWLSRARVGYGDRQAMLMTGNPNGMARALVKWAIATTDRVIDHKSLPPLLELTQLLSPVPPPQAIALGSLYPHSPLEPYLQWEQRNPYRHWMRSNNTHPTLGDRLFRLSQWAERWKLDPEWDLSSDNANAQSLKYIPRIGTACLPPTPFTLWSQAAPMVGAILGIGIGLLLWMPGGIGEMLNWRWLNWMYNDHRSLLAGLALIGFGSGTILRVNSFFPDIKTLGLTPSGTPERPLAAELNDPNALPVNSRIVRLQGHLLGRPAPHNLLAQDWWLQTETGILRLHLGDRWGYLGQLWRFLTRPIQPDQPVEVVGWLRRGATPWLDVDIINRPNTPSHQFIKQSWTKIDGHPLWSTGIATGAIALGLWILNQGL